MIGELARPATGLGGGLQTRPDRCLRDAGRLRGQLAVRAIVASLPPDRPFTLHREMSLIAETEPTPAFGHAVHTRGMMKVGRPDLIAGVPPTGSRKPDGSSTTSPGCWPRATSSCQDSDCVSRAKNRDGHALRSGRHHSGRQPQQRWTADRRCLRLPTMSHPTHPRTVGGRRAHPILNFLSLLAVRVARDEAGDRPAT